MEMATQTTVRLVDDIDGTEATETIKFGIGADAYEIDLSADNAAKFREALAQFRDAARPVSAKGGRRLHAVAATKAAAPGRVRNGETAAKREWLAANGFPGVMGRRGRFSDAENQAWEAHQKGEAAPVAPRKVEEPPVVEAPAAPQEEAPAGTCTRMTGLSRFQVGTLKDFTDLVIDSGASWALLKGFPVDVIREIEHVRATTNFPEVGDGRALAFVLRKLFEGKGVKTVDAA